jgi:putative ABC transport system ATP-binding protein
MSLLELSHVSKTYRAGSRGEVRALEDVSLAIVTGSLTILTGASGSGKSTLLALLGALERPSRGEVLFDGRSLAGFSDAGLARLRRRIGFVFQNFSLIPSLPAWENVTYPLVPRGIPRGERFERAQALLARLGLTDKLTAPPQELSGGEQQRLAVARALIGGPDLLLADEPTSNLDRESGRLLTALFREVHAAGRTVVVASHDPEFLTDAAQVYELEAGRLKGQP